MRYPMSCEWAKRLLPALALVLAALCGACKSSDSYTQDEVPKGVALVVTQGSRVEGDGHSWDLNNSTHGAKLVSWLRVWKDENVDQTFVIWMPGSAPPQDVMSFMSYLDAAGIEDWKILKGRELH
ncbi:MAG: hypothetical protein ACI835_005962 [Planctomycetota bacterium]|jgi:hypothetical protein